MAAKVPALECRTAMCADCAGNIICALKPFEHVKIASTTKIMTVLLGCEATARPANDPLHVALDEQVLIPSWLANEFGPDSGCSIFLYAPFGDTHSFFAPMRECVMVSGNDSAHVIANTITDEANAWISHTVSLTLTLSPPGTVLNVNLAPFQRIALPAWTSAVAANVHWTIRNNTSAATALLSLDGRFDFAPNLSGTPAPVFRASLTPDTKPQRHGWHFGERNIRTTPTFPVLVAAEDRAKPANYQGPHALYQDFFIPAPRRFFRVVGNAQP